MKRKQIYKDSFLEEILQHEKTEKAPNFFTDAVMNKISNLGVEEVVFQPKNSFFDRFEYIIPTTLLALFSLFIFFREAVISFLSNLNVVKSLTSSLEDSIFRFFQFKGVVELSYVFIVSATLFGILIVANTLWKKREFLIKF